MSHRSLFWPLALIAVTIATLVPILANSPADLGTLTVSAAIDCPTEISNPTYPNCLKTQTAEQSVATETPDYSRIISGCPTDGPAQQPPYPPYAQCLQTRTAILLQTEQARATATSPPAQSQPTSTLTSTSAITTTPTLTRTATQAAPTSPAETGTPSATRTSAPSPTAEAPEDLANALECIPGETIAIEGSTEPRAALIVTFGDRPVGGGFSNDNGNYGIRLHIGDERPGTYPVVIEERTTGSLVQELLCRVPAIPPTPTPALLP